MDSAPPVTVPPVMVPAKLRVPMPVLFRSQVRPVLLAVPVSVALPTMLPTVAVLKLPPRLRMPPLWVIVPALLQLSAAL